MLRRFRPTISRLDDPDAEAPRTVVFDFTEGLRNTEFNRRAACRGRQGELFFGGMAGLTVFVPGGGVERSGAPPVVLTSLEISNREGTTRVPQVRDHLRLSYRDTSIEFEFAALNYTNPSRNRYAYRLEGFERQWADNGTLRRARYTNIPPGDYVFRVKAANHEGRWNEPGLSLPVTITPPFWATWWFRLLIATALIAIVVAVHRYRLSKLLEVERLRLRIAGDLHDDLGSELSAIALFAQSVQQSPRLREEEREVLERIKQTARGAGREARDTVWSLDPGQDTLSDLVSRMEETGVPLLENVEFRVESDGLALDRGLPMELRRNFFLCFKEILHNIARHARARHVDVTLKSEGRELVLVVVDDGVGFEPERARNGHGLGSLRRRAASDRGREHSGTGYPGDPEGPVPLKRSMPKESTDRRGAPGSALDANREHPNRRRRAAGGCVARDRLVTVASSLFSFPRKGREG